MATKFFIICIVIYLQMIQAQVNGRAINNGFYGSPISGLTVYNLYVPYGRNMRYPANTMAYDIANSFHGPANSLAYDGIANSIYGPANPLIYDGIDNGIYGPANTLAYEGIANGIYGPTVPCENIGYGLTVASLSASNGGSFTVKSSSQMSVKGISVESENMVIEGPLLVNGQLPFLGTIGLEGAMPVTGNGAVSYGCGDGNVGILNGGYPTFAGPLVEYRCNGMPTSAPTAARPFGTNKLSYGY